jgi:adenylyltransferase/sulfurtransferase
VVSAAEKLRRQFSGLAVTAEQAVVSHENALALFRAHDVVVDATDGVDTKFLLSDASVLSGTPLVYGGVLRFEGLAMRLQPGGPCLRCLFESAPPDAPTCAQAGVLGSMSGLMGGLQAELALTPSPVPGEARLAVVDGLSLTARSVRVRRRPDCLACGPGAALTLQPVAPPTCAVPTGAPRG